MKKLLTPGLLVASALIVVAIASRFIPHPAAFTPVGAVALFAGFYFRQKRWALIIPILVLSISNLFLGFFDVITTVGVYAGFMLTALVGILISKKVSTLRVISGSLASAVLFFLISNFGVWMSGFCGYPMSFAGLIQCYTMGLPFFRNDIIGTLFYSGILFGAFELAKLRFPALARI